MDKIPDDDALRRLKKDFNKNKKVSKVLLPLQVLIILTMSHKAIHMLYIKGDETGLTYKQCVGS